MTLSAGTLAQTIVVAQQESLSRVDRLATLNLTPIGRKAPALPIAEAVRSAKVTLTIDGACYLTIALHDPEWLIERSGITDLNADGRLDSNVVVTIDRLRFRVVKAARSGPTITLTAEDEAKVLLDQHSKKLKASRGTMTRAEFIERLVAEIKARDLLFVSPEIHKRQPVARPELPNTRPHGTTGFDDGASFKIKGETADAGQMREVATAMGEADQLDVTPRVRLAALVAGIQESLFRTGAKDYDTGTHQGVFQSNQIAAKNTQQQAHYFFKGGRSFLAGGAIGYAAAHPSASVGEIAKAVEISNGSVAVYQQHHDEAVKIADLWQSGNGDANHKVLTYKAFEFTRGLPGKKETSWQAATRLARDVNWRFFAVGGVVCFVSDDYLLSQPASLIIDALDDQGTFRTPPGLLRRPDYDHDEGKIVSEVTLEVIAGHWAVLPGEVVVIRNMGSASGRRIVQTFEFDLFDPMQSTVTLVKTLQPRKEPAPQAALTQVGDDSVPGGANKALAWARSKIGDFKEEFGANIGPELDKLEQQFGMRGAPWCAMFATTALVHGGISRDCRTASVRDLNAWAQAGTHGLQQGYRATAKPADLMVFGNDHVALVEKVHPDGSVDTIEGNTGAGLVATHSRAKGSGQFIRPDYAA